MEHQEDCRSHGGRAKVRDNGRLDERKLAQGQFATTVMDRADHLHDEDPAKQARNNADFKGVTV